MMMNNPMKTRKQIAIEYNICEKTLRRYLKRFKIELPTGLIPPKYQQLIYEELGKPPSQKEE